MSIHRREVEKEIIKPLTAEAGIKQPNDELRLDQLVALSIADDAKAAAANGFFAIYFAYLYSLWKGVLIALACGLVVVCVLWLYKNYILAQIRDLKRGNPDR